MLHAVQQQHQQEQQQQQQQPQHQQTQQLDENGVDDENRDVRNMNSIEEINTKEVAAQITAELKRYSIPQAIFAQRVLCRSQVRKIVVAR